MAADARPQCVLANAAVELDESSTLDFNLTTWKRQ
jgi:hypothetical protein